MTNFTRQARVGVLFACSIFVLFLGSSAVAESLPHSTVENRQQIALNEDNSLNYKLYRASQLQHSGYVVNFEDVFNFALDVSHEYHALTREVESKEILLNKEERYYYPDATLNSETTEYWGNPTPDATETQDFVLTLHSKLYGSSVKDKIAASQMTLDAGQIGLTAQEVSIYYTVLKYLTKIELTRQYQSFSEALRKDIEVYYLKQVNSTDAGVATQSDAMQAKLAVAEFDDTVYSVISNIEQYFNQLVEETGIDINLDDPAIQDRIGIDYERIEPLLAKDVTLVTTDELLKNNAELQQAQKNLNSTLYNARSTRERLTVDVTSESHMLTNGDSGTHTYGDTDESFVQLNIELDIFNHASQSDEDAAYKLYEAEKFRFDMQFKQTLDKFNTSVTIYNQQLTQRQKTAEQVDILTELIENQKEEIYTDQVTYKDIVESISKLNKAKQTLLNIDLSLFDSLYELESLKSNKVL